MNFPGFLEKIDIDLTWLDLKEKKEQKFISWQKQTNQKQIKIHALSQQQKKK
jgi:hypothetical protein